MKVIRARVDGQLLFLTPDQDLDALKASIVEAIRKGGDFVEFSTVGRELISILVTPSLPVWFEVLEKTEEQLEEWELHPPSLDLDEPNSLY